MKSRLNTPWTDDDRASVRRSAKAGFSAREAARIIGRSRGSVAYWAMVHGVRFSAVKQPVGTQKRRFRKAKRA